MRALGKEVVQFGEGKTILTVQVDDRFHSPMGTLHGGMMTDLADASMGVAIMSTLGDEESFTTLELKMNFLRPIQEGELTAESRVLHKGRTITLTESVLKNGEGKEVARAIATRRWSCTHALGTEMNRRHSICDPVRLSPTGRRT